MRLSGSMTVSPNAENPSPAAADGGANAGGAATAADAAEGAGEAASPLVDVCPAAVSTSLTVISPSGPVRGDGVDVDVQLAGPAARERDGRAGPAP